MKRTKNDLRPGSKETDHLWVRRIQSVINDKIEQKRKSGTSINRIILLMPPPYLERIYAVMFVCSIDEARVIIRDETRRLGSLTLFGSMVVSNQNIEAPEVQILGDLRETQRNTKSVKNKHYGNANKLKL